MDEITLIEVDPACLRLNVLTQTASQSCIIFNAMNNLQRLSKQCRAQIFILRNIYVPVFLQELRSIAANKTEGINESNITDEEYQYVTSINKEQFNDIFTSCRPVLIDGKLRY